MSRARIIPITPQALAASAAPGTASGLAAPPPLSLYIHYPWCVKKCPYCDFNSHALREEPVAEEAYIDALIGELHSALPTIWGRRIHTIFIGGGTPSLMSAASLARLLDAVRLLLPLAGDAEITLEANPGTVEAAKFAAFRGAGVTRVSLGIQSFNPQHLQALGRIHDGDEARAAIALAAKHFDTWNIDLMYALPGQSLAQAQADIEAALAFDPPHLSCYHLTLEPNTLFYREPPELPDDDASADMQDMIEARLAAASYQHYETSAFAKAGQRCRHNLNYWHFGDYLGIGAGAHGKLSLPSGIVREARHRHPKAYLEGALKGDLLQERRTVSVAELPFEFMMNALRLTEGVPSSSFSATTGLPLASIAAQLEHARQQGLMEANPQRLQPTPKGRRFLNELLQIFLKD